MPRVTICIPVFNHEQFVTESINSVIAQDYENIELIIIDDCSSDASSNMIERLLSVCEKRFARFEYRKHNINKGLCVTLNEALEWSAGEYFSPIASDDALLKNKISGLLPYIHGKPGIAAVFGGVEFIDANGLNSGRRWQKKHIYKFEDIVLLAFPCAPGALIRVKDMKKAGGYYPGLLIEDWYMWLKLTESGSVLVSVPLLVAKYRLHETNITKNLKKIHDGRLAVLEHFKYHPLYEKAISRAFTNSAHQLANHDFFAAMKMLKKATKENILKKYKEVVFALAMAVKRITVKLYNDLGRWLSKLKW